jgi:hypothetical protein
MNLGDKISVLTLDERPNLNEVITDTNSRLVHLKLVGEASTEILDFQLGNIEITFTKFLRDLP